MKKFRKVTGVLLAATLLFSSAGLSASAKPTSGLDIIPITDPDFWEAESGDNFYDVLNNDAAWTNTTIDENGYLTVQRTANAKKDYNWPRVRTLAVELMPAFSLKDNPYLYYDLECTTGWNIGFVFNGMAIGLAKPIMNNTDGAKHLDDYQADGEAGTFKGKINLKEYIDSEPNFALIHGQDTLLAPMVNVFIVDTTPDHTSGKLTIRQLSVGNDDPNAPDGVKLDSSVITGEDPDEEPDPDTEDTTTTAPASTTTEKKTTTSAVKTTTTAAKGGSEDGGSNTLMIVLIIVAAVVVPGAAAAVVVIRKRKSVPPSDDNGPDQPTPPSPESDQ